MVDGVIREMTDEEQAEYDARQKQSAEQIKSEKEQLKESGVQLDLDLKVVDVEIEE